MSSEDTLIQVRQEKHQQLNGGTYPLASSTFIHINELLDFMSDPPPPVSLDPKELGRDVLIHGRITNFRKSGGITFLKLTDGSGSMQVIASKGILTDQYDSLKLWDLGDIIEVSGRPCTSKTNEPSVLMMNAKVLTKSHRAPPEKYVGITDTELKYRKRYLDLMSSEESRALFTVRSCIIRGLRQYLTGLDFMEVETSTLNSIASGANAKPFTTHHNALETDLFLRIAPELYLKRLLVGGFEKVFEIGRAYRNEGLSTRHNPEFSILEFYQAYGSFQELLQLCIRMLNFVDVATESYLMRNNGFALPYYKKWKQERSFTLSKVETISMQQAVINGLNVAGMATHGPDQKPVLLNESDKQERTNQIDIKGLEYELSQAKTSGSRLSIYFEYVAEPFLTQDYRTTINEVSYSVPVFITDYPVEICPLARPKDGHPSVCDRFELFIEGRELANAFQELNDPDEQARQFKLQLDGNQKDAMDFDADYIEALEYGLPPCIGLGLGIDRLVMLLTNSQSIKDVILFPTLKPSK